LNAAMHGVMVGLPVLLVHLALTTGLLLAGLWLYIKLAPFREIELLRQNNLAAAIVFGGQMLGLSIPLAAMMASSVNLLDILLWGVVTVALQFFAIFCLRLLLPGTAGCIARGETAPATVFACGQIVAGLLTAASLSG
jgi:putative membrane protein